MLQGVVVWLAALTSFACSLVMRCLCIPSCVPILSRSCLIDKSFRVPSFPFMSRPNFELVDV